MQAAEYLSNAVRYPEEQGMIRVEAEENIGVLVCSWSNLSFCNLIRFVTAALGSIPVLTTSAPMSSSTSSICCLIEVGNDELVFRV